MNYKDEEKLLKAFYQAIQKQKSIENIDEFLHTYVRRNSKRSNPYRSITIEYYGIEFEIEYLWQPYEAQTMDYPGMGAHVEEISKMEYKGTDFLDAFEHDIEKIMEIVEKEVEAESAY